MVVVVSIAVLQVCMSREQLWLVFLSCWLCNAAFGWLLVPLATGETPNQDQSFVAAMKSAFRSSCVHFCFLKNPFIVTHTRTFEDTFLDATSYTLAIPRDYAFCSLIAMLTIRPCCGALLSRFALLQRPPRQRAGLGVTAK